jgi:hypothetical protein
MVKVLKQVLNDDIHLSFLLLIPPWYEAGESNLGSGGMVRVLKQVPQSSLCVGPKASPKVLFNSRPLKQCMTYKNNNMKLIP